MNLDRFLKAVSYLNRLNSLCYEESHSLIKEVREFIKLFNETCKKNNLRLRMNDVAIDHLDYLDVTDMDVIKLSADSKWLIIETYVYDFEERYRYTIPMGWFNLPDNSTDRVKEEYMTMFIELIINLIKNKMINDPSTSTYSISDLAKLMGF